MRRVWARNQLSTGWYVNIFVLFGTLLWLAILAGLSVSLLVLLVLACVRKNWKFALKSIVATAGTMVIATGVFVGLAYLWFRPYDPTSESDLKKTYQADFGNLPPAGISVLKARQVIVGDSGGQWLLLKSTPEEIERHIGMGFTNALLNPHDFGGGTGGNIPKWWRPPTNRLEFYENNNWSKAGGWSWSSAAIGVDRGSNLIWFVTTKSD